MQRFRSSLAIVLFILVLGWGSDAVRIVHPADDGTLEYIPDIPLWVRLEKGEGECFDIVVDGVSQTISCDEDTILSLQPRSLPTHKMGVHCSSHLFPHLVLMLLMPAEPVSIYAAPVSCRFRLFISHVAPIFFVLRACLLTSRSSFLWLRNSLS